MKDLYTSNLFTKTENFKVTRISQKDVTLKSDKYTCFRELIKSHEPMYPNIEKWLTEKVVPGIKIGERIAYMGTIKNNPVVSAVLKLGENAKFCHLHINNEYQNRLLGDLFFSIMTVDTRRLANYIHFTLPQSLWEDKKSFFKSFGFEGVEKAKKQYRNSEDEFLCTASFKTVWVNTLSKLPKLIDNLSDSDDNIFNGLLMSIKPEYTNQIERGEKVIELRKRFNKKWIGRRVTIYSSKPTSAILGYATISNVIDGEPMSIWYRYKKELGCTKQDFLDYINGSDIIYAISLNNFQSYISPMYIDQLSFLIDKELKPPQSYLSLENNPKWSEAVSIAEILHGRFQLTTATI